MHGLKIATERGRLIEIPTEDGIGDACRQKAAIDKSGSTAKRNLIVVFKVLFAQLNICSIIGFKREFD